MHLKNVRASVCIHRRRRTGPIAEVKLLERISGTEYLVPGGVMFCEVEWITEVIKALRWAHKTAEEDGWLDYYAEEGEEGSHE